MQEIRISVVTVCLNVIDTIGETVKSVLGQTYDNMEYIIVDGMSTDGTLEMIRHYEDRREVQVVSGKDNGLYSAMNKGIDLSNGDYILFLNSGDVFAHETVVDNVVTQIRGFGETKDGQLDKNRLPDIVYGNVTKIYSQNRINEKYSGRNKVFQLLMMGKMPCHQGIFAKTSVLRKFRFDEAYKICADFDFLMRCFREHVRMQYVDVNVSIVDCITGISSQEANIDRMRAEDDRSIRNSYPWMYYLMWLPKKMVRAKGKWVKGNTE